MRLSIILLFILTIIGNAFGYSTPESILSNGEYYLSAVTISQKLHAHIFYSPASMVVVLKYNDIKGKFIVSKDSAIIDGEVISTGVYPIIWDNDMYFPVKILNKIYNIPESETANFTKDAIDISKKTVESKLEKKVELKEIPKTTEIVINKNTINISKGSYYDNRDNSAEVLISNEVSSTQEIYNKDKMAIFSDMLKSNKGFSIIGKLINSIASQSNDSIEISLLSDKEKSPIFLNSKAYKIIFFIKIGAMKSKNYSGISFFFWKYEAEKDMNSMMTISNIFRNIFEKGLSNYDGNINFFIYPFKDAEFINIPCVMIELGNISSKKDIAWLKKESNIDKLRDLIIKAGSQL